MFRLKRSEFQPAYLRLQESGLRRFPLQIPSQTAQ